ncbi:MAG TPA: hypothetical protein VEL28_22025 [Candidatus Binatia bacterium]|nr:hypothetical protein [Candidatus Binatia bacterium]
MPTWCSDLAIREDDPASSDDAAKDASEAAAAAVAEARLEELADDIARVIEAGPAADRESLHDYAVSLVRERLPVAHDDSRFQGTRTAQNAKETAQGGLTKVAFGYGVLVLPVGLLVSLLFPPVGITLVLIGAGMMAVGAVSGLAAKLIPGSRRKAE